VTPSPDGIDVEALKAALDARAPTSEYARGVVDLLRLLGLLHDADGHLAPADEVAAMILDSLRAHLRDGVAVGLRWGDLDGEPPRGVDFLRAIEAARLVRIDDPTPGRVVQVVQAIIKAGGEGGDRYLMQYDRHAAQYQSIGGKQNPGDTDAPAALRREIGEELGLDRPPGPADCPLTLLKADWGTIKPSATYGILTRYAFDFFHVERVSFPLATDADTRWLTRAEVAAGQADDGRAISTVYQEALGLAALDALPATVGT
jgi:8-oxo-dGTP pyrophosphatase MutT (NUDIX family)